MTALLVAFLTAWAVPAFAGTAEGGKLVVFLVDRVNVEELPSDRTPYCSELADRGSSGLMMTRVSGGGRGAEYVTLGAGMRAAGAGDAGLSFNYDEKPFGFSREETAGQFYRSVYGVSPGKGTVLCLGLAEVERENEGSSTEAEPGLLGDELEDSGVRVGVVGNADTYRQLRRFAPLIVCNHDATVGSGDVGESLDMVDPSFPCGYRTDPEALESAFLRVLEQSDLVIVDTGDTMRVESERGYLSGATYFRAKESALSAADSMIRDMCSHIDLEDSLVVVISPGPPEEQRVEEGNHLTPIIIAGEGIESGLISSRSTRRTGLVDNTDFAPTILDHFGLAIPEEMVGSPFEFHEDGASLQYLRSLSGSLGVARSIRWPLVVGYVIAAALLLAAAVLVLVERSMSIDKYARLIGLLRGMIPPLSTILLSVPMGLLLVSLLSYERALTPVIFCVAFPVGLGLVTWWFFRRFGVLWPQVVICLSTVILLVADVFTGWNLLMRPLLGASALEGSRFYGIPNAYVGVILGCAVMGTAGMVWELRNRSGGDSHIGARQRALVLMLFIGLALVVGLGALGANIGGFITVLTTGLVFYFALSGRGIDARRALVTLASVVVGLAMVIGLDILFFSSHGARAGSRIAASGPRVVIGIIGSKLTVSLGQINYFLVPALLLIAGAIMVLLWIGGDSPVIRRAWVGLRPMMAGFYSVLLGAVVGLVVNDTGVVVCGMLAMVGSLFLVVLLANGAFAGKPGNSGIDQGRGAVGFMQ